MVGAGIAGLLAVGLAPVLTSGVAGAASPAPIRPPSCRSTRPVIGTGQAGTAGGDIRIGAATDTFDAGDQITLQVAQPGVGTPTTVGPSRLQNANCNDARPATAQSGVGDRRFVSFAATPTAAGPTGGTLTLLPGVPSSSTAAGANGTVPGFCNVQDGGTKTDIFVFTVATCRPRPDRHQQHQVRRRSWHRPGEQRWPDAPRLNSTTTGPVRIFMFFSNVKNGVTTLTKANSANGCNEPRRSGSGIGSGRALTDLDSNAWVTTNTLTGPPKAFTTTIGGATITQDRQRHHDR